MAELIYNENNTEGAHSTAFEFRGAELQKNGKCVTTSLVACYDTEIINPTQNQVIKYDETKEKWVNGESSGGGCNIITGYNYLTYTNALFINENSINPIHNGNYTSPFVSLKECIEFLNETCAVIPKDIFITIVLLSNITINDIIYLNHPYGNRLILDCYDKIINISPTVIVSNIEDYSIASVDYPKASIILDNASFNIKNITLNDTNYTVLCEDNPISDNIGYSIWSGLYINGSYISPDKYILKKIKSRSSMLISNNSNINLLNGDIPIGGY